MKAEKCGGILPLEILKTWDTEGAWFLVPKYFQWQSPSSIMFHNWLAQHPVTTAYPVIYCCIVMSYDFIYFFAEEIMPTSWLYRWCVLKPPYFQGASWNEVRTRKVLGSLSQILGACSLMILQEALHSSMLGRPGKEDPEMMEENLEFDELLGFAADQSSFSHWFIHLLGKSTGNQSKAGRGRRWLGGLWGWRSRWWTSGFANKCQSFSHTQGTV